MFSSSTYYLAFIERGWCRSETIQSKLIRTPEKKVKLFKFEDQFFEIFRNILRLVNGLTTRNILRLVNGLTTRNILRLVNGLTTRNILRLVNGLTTRNILKLVNGLAARMSNRKLRFLQVFIN
jgi:hypothetical protein